MNEKNIDSFFPYIKYFSSVKKDQNSINIYKYLID